MSDIKVVDNISFQVRFQLESMSEYMDIKFNGAKSIDTFYMDDALGFYLKDLDVLIEALTLFKSEAIKRDLL